MKNYKTQNELHQIIISFFNNYFSSKFDTTIIEKIFFFQNNIFYEIKVKDGKFLFETISISSIKYKCDLLFAFIESGKNDNDLYKIINKITNDLVFLISSNKYIPEAFIKHFENNFVELKDFDGI